MDTRFISDAANISSGPPIAAKKPPADRMRIGWREWVRLPDLTGTPIKAKVDTGAKTSAIHAFAIREVDRAGVSFVSFYLHPVQRRKNPSIYCEAPIADRRIIRSSNGAQQERIVIKTTLQLGERTWAIDLSLTNRDDMGFRMLIGRDALKKRVLIAPGRSFVLGR